ncbi:hypothetical protein [Iningainema tapete]|uniref:Uncharacterized protein n=1 Tax=Iningainema tapete BLCC-T55 TaxID=2748662 RepID=A0A8J6XTM0_9CYAN|nr:hypothetical protein [Iningainema tapete]MBD2778234.1 hypothetical protein [Iningainema tapete BLCC-T55]
MDNLNSISEVTEVTAIVPVASLNQPITTGVPNRALQYRIKKLNTYRYLMAAGLVAGLALHGLIRFGGSYNIGSVDIRHLAQGSIAAHGSILSFIFGDRAVAETANQKKQPFATKYVNGGTPTPDWTNITFKDMKFGEAGSVEFPNIKNPGMKETRSWEAGQSLADVMELGDFEATEFKIEELSLKDIAKITGIDLKELKLDSLELTNWQTIANLSDSIPDLGDMLVSDFPPINDAIQEITGSPYSGTISSAIETFPELEQAELGKYIKLSDYNLTDIPGIESAPLKKFYNWQNTTIGLVPGLADVPFDQFPGILIPDMSFVGKVDLPLREVEANRWKSISGSYQEGFNVPCTKNCAHIEVAGSDNLTGAQWMSGKFQKVKGGFGILGNLNGGKEPTGRHPFGKAFKQVIWDINEASGSITTAMFFRICKRGGFIDLGCSPYFIGPVPFFTYKEMDPIILGTPLSVPKKVAP